METRSTATRPSANKRANKSCGSYCVSTASLLPVLVCSILVSTTDTMLPPRPPFLLVLCITFATLGASQDSVDDYAPNTNAQCPDLSTTSLIRVFTPQNQSLHPRETEYVNTRTTSVLPDAWKAWLGDGSAVSYNLSAFQGKFPKVGIAIPGGGLRAAQYGAGCLSGLDARNESAKAAGTGGLLQVTSYISGLSGVCRLALKFGCILNHWFPRWFMGHCLIVI
jgi:Lysophospholipase catalytic domain.